MAGTEASLGKCSVAIYVGENNLSIYWIDEAGVRVTTESSEMKTSENYFTSELFVTLNATVNSKQYRCVIEKNNDRIGQRRRFLELAELLDTIAVKIFF